MAYTQPASHGPPGRPPPTAATLPRRTTMFNKKTDETEWSRFSRALGGRESEREEPTEAAPETAAAAPAPPPAPTAASRPAAQDTMVNVTRAPQPPTPRAVDEVD